MCMITFQTSVLHDVEFPAENVPQSQALTVLMGSDSRQCFHCTCHPSRIPSLCGASVPTPPGGTTTTQALFTATGLSRERQQCQLGFQTLYFMSVFNISAPEYFPRSLVSSALPFEASAAMQCGQMLCCRRLHIVCIVCLNGESRLLPRNEMIW